MLAVATAVTTVRAARAAARVVVAVEALPHTPPPPPVAPKPLTLAVSHDAGSVAGEAHRCQCPTGGRVVLVSSGAVAATRAEALVRGEDDVDATVEWIV